MNEHPDAMETAELAMERGWEARRIERYDLAHQMFSYALALARGQGDRLGTASALIALADNACHYIPNRDGTVREPLNLDVRRDLCISALRITKKMNDSSGTCKALLLLATTEDPQKGRSMCEEALTIAKDADLGSLVCKSLSQLGAMCNLCGNRANGTEYRSEAVSLARALGDANALCDALTSQCFCFDLEHDKATVVFDELSTLCRDLNRIGDLVRLLILRATTSQERLDLGTQRRLLCEAVALAKEIGAEDLASTSEQCLQRLDP